MKLLLVRIWRFFWGPSLLSLVRDASALGKITLTQAGYGIAPGGTHARLGWSCSIRSPERPESELVNSDPSTPWRFKRGGERFPQVCWMGSGETIEMALQEAIGAARERSDE